MNLNKYKSGAGLDKIALQYLFNFLQKKNGKLDNINILEFGSGYSTQFLVDYKLFSGKNIYIDSFDNDINWCFPNSDKYSFLNLSVDNLLSCTDEHFNEQIKNKVYEANYFKEHNNLPYDDPKYWRQKNCFYNIKNLKDKYDLIIIDGPNGNGRVISYLHIKDKIKKGTFILIDDHNSRDGDFDYKFIEHFKNIIHLPIKEIYIHENNINPSWENGVNFALFEIL
tara:strand:+ start:611 stop:1285 length:675 start_codon:yes stop_codon:yes gene_type:complete